MQAIGDRIRLIRREHGFSQSELARRSGVKQPFISKIERRQQKPSPTTIDRIATAFEKAGEDLVKGTDCESHYLASRLSPETLHKKHADDARSEKLRRSADLSMLNIYYRRIVSIFDVLHEGYTFQTSPALEEIYQRIVPLVEQIAGRISEWAPGVECELHLPETTDAAVRNPGVEHDMLGIEEEALYDYVDRPAFAKSELYLRILRQRFPDYDIQDIYELAIANKLSGYDGISQADELIETYRRAKRDYERRWLARVERIGKQFRNRGAQTLRGHTAPIQRARFRLGRPQ